MVKQQLHNHCYYFRYFNAHSLRTLLLYYMQFPAETILGSIFVNCLLHHRTAHMHEIKQLVVSDFQKPKFRNIL